MKPEIREVQIGDRRVRIGIRGTEGPCFIWGMFPGEKQDGDTAFLELWERIKKVCQESDLRLIGFQVEDWNRDYSPWNASGKADQALFEGEGVTTLDWLRKDCLPWIREEFPGTEIFTMGYSLAGLFALWSMYEIDSLSGSVCASGSLWFDDWDIYMKERENREALAKSGRQVYLSLGGKEEHTKDPRMAKIGERTRTQISLLKNDPTVSRCVLEWNSGGHFADPVGRLVKGIRWLLAGLQENGRLFQNNSL